MRCFIVDWFPYIGMGFVVTFGVGMLGLCIYRIFDGTHGGHP